MPPSAASFRYAFVPVWRLQTTITTIAVFGTKFAITLGAGKPIERPDIVSSILISLFCAACIAVVLAVAKFKVTPLGLRTFNTFGKWSEVPWSSVSLAEPGHYYFAPHLKLTVDDATVKYWIPMSIQDMAGFRKAVLEMAGEGNPIYRALPTPASRAARIEA